MKEALKLTLEALERYQIKRQDFDTFVDVITAIKEALAQPDYRAVKTYHEGKPVYVSQPEQEPMATMKMLHTYGDTTPPQRPWVGLTDDEMQALWDRYAYMEMMRAIEAKLKELNT